MLRVVFPPFSTHPFSLLVSIEQPFVLELFPNLLVVAL